MFIIKEDNRILLTKGDTATIEVKAYDNDGNEYQFKETDTISFKVKETPSAETSISKTADSNHIISLIPSDTSNLKSGLYLYDVQVTTTDGNIYTIIPQSYFEIRDEIS